MCEELNQLLIFKYSWFYIFPSDPLIEWTFLNLLYFNLLLNNSFFFCFHFQYPFFFFSLVHIFGNENYRFFSAYKTSANVLGKSVTWTFFSFILKINDFNVLDKWCSSSMALSFWLTIFFFQFQQKNWVLIIPSPSPPIEQTR